MRTSLNELKEMEEFLSGTMKPGETLLFRARLLLDPALRRNLSLLQRCHAVIRWYGRKELKEKIQSVHNRVFTDPGRTAYRRSIEQLFHRQ
ncbi:MAG: hypothetical protein LOY03_15265 [Cyclobacteriaceae bacterium]|jgi:hypothetical protein|nr:hypothetical protein [Cyclobacteriaceae bacterium]